MSVRGLEPPAPVLNLEMSTNLLIDSIPYATCGLDHAHDGLRNILSCCSSRLKVGSPLMLISLTIILMKQSRHIEGRLLCLLAEVYPKVSREEFAGVSSGLEQHTHRLECNRKSADAELQ